MVLRKIVHHIAPAIHRARAYTADAEEGYQRSGIAFKTNKGTNNNVKWQSTVRSEKIQHCQDWEIVWDEESCNVPTSYCGYCKTPRRH